MPMRNMHSSRLVAADANDIDINEKRRTLIWLMGAPYGQSSICHNCITHSYHDNIIIHKSVGGSEE